MEELSQKVFLTLQPACLQLGVGSGGAPIYITAHDPLAGKTFNIQWGKTFLPYLLSSQWGGLCPPHCAGPSLQDCSLRAGLAAPGHAVTSPTSKKLLEAGVVQQTHLPFKNLVWPVKQATGSWCRTVGYWLLGTAVPMGLQLLPIASPW